MYDDGTNGDEVAGDGYYTVRVALNRPIPGNVTFRASAGRTGTITRVFSNLVEMTVE